MTYNETKKNDYYPTDYSPKRHIDKLTALKENKQ